MAFPFHRMLRVQAPSPQAIQAGAPLEDDDGPAGCGWFDSSHDLLAGLFVVELPPGEGVAEFQRSCPGAA